MNQSESAQGDCFPIPSRPVAHLTGSTLGLISGLPLRAYYLGSHTAWLSEDGYLGSLGFSHLLLSQPCEHSNFPTLQSCPGRTGQHPIPSLSFTGTPLLQHLSSICSQEQLKTRETDVVELIKLCTFLQLNLT